MKNKVLLLLFILISVCITGCETTTYYVVRHAEKETSNPTDPDPLLTAAGSARAITLCDTLKNKGIDTLFATQYQRTQLTAAPTASFLRKSTTIINTANTNNLIAGLKNIHGKSVLVVGHTNTIPQIIQELCGEVISPIAETDYDNMYIIKIQQRCSGKVDTTFTHTAYGATTN